MTTNSLLASIVAESEKDRIWAKGRIIPEWDERVWRWDHAGNVIRYSDYGDRSSEYGWEKGHVVAAAVGGAATIFNLRPEHWRLNASQGGLLAAVLARRG